VIHDVVGGAADEELDRPGSRQLTGRVVGADRIEVGLSMCGQAICGEHVPERRPDLDLARELVRLGEQHMLDHLVAAAPAAASSGTEVRRDPRCDVVEGRPAGTQKVEPPFQLGR